LFFKKITSIYLKKVITVLVFFVTLTGFSQTDFRIIERNDFLTSIGNSSTRNSANHDQVLDLMDGVQMSIYLTNNGARIYGQTPICLYTDIASLSLANSSDLRVDNIEMVTIKIDKPSELTSVIDLSTVSRFKNVKYIYFRVGFNFNLPQLRQLIKNCDPKCVLIYSIEKGA
jgi:hypothetical protein